MLKQVLESVSEMLEDSLRCTPKTTTNSETAMSIVYIKCAKTLLDRAISTLEPTMPSADRPPSLPSSKRSTGLRPELVPSQSELEPLIEVDSNTKELKKISISGKEIDLEVMVILDDVAMPYKEAKGKNFRTGRLA